MNWIFSLQSLDSILIFVLTLCMPLFWKLSHVYFLIALEFNLNAVCFVLNDWFLLSPKNSFWDSFLIWLSCCGWLLEYYWSCLILVSKCFVTSMNGKVSFSSPLNPFQSNISIIILMKLLSNKLEAAKLEDCFTSSQFIVQFNFITNLGFLKKSIYK